MVCACPPRSHAGLRYGGSGSRSASSCGNACALPSTKSGLQAPDDRLDDLDPRVPLVLRLDERPRCDLRARAVDHVADGYFVGVPFLPVAPVVGRDLEPLERDLLARVEPSQLLSPADLQPELD